MPINVRKTNSIWWWINRHVWRGIIRINLIFMFVFCFWCLTYGYGTVHFGKYIKGEVIIIKWSATYSRRFLYSISINILSYSVSHWTLNMPLTHQSSRHPISAANPQNEAQAQLSSIISSFWYRVNQHETPKSPVTISKLLNALTSNDKWWCSASCTAKSIRFDWRMQSSLTADRRRLSHRKKNILHEISINQNRAQHEN